MHIMRKPALALMLGVFLAVAAAWLFSGSFSGPNAGEVEAVVPVDSVSCADVWLGPVGTGIRVAISMTRLDDLADPQVALTQNTYLGRDSIPGDANPVPDVPPDEVTCQVSSAAAAGAAENNDLEPTIKLAVIGDQDRPTVSPTASVSPAAVGPAETGGQCQNFTDDDGDSSINDGCNQLNYSTCVFSEATGQWIRTDVFTSIVNKGAGAKNTGTGVFHVGTTPPSDSPTSPSANPTSCTDKTTGSFPDGVATLTYPLTIHTYTRNATTDDTAQQPGIPADPSGTSGTPIGDQGPDTADGLADDWDGDGCTDWDEMADTPVKKGRGSDPFNPNDCDKNWDGVYNLLTTVAPAGGGANNFPNRGIYFNCISRIFDTKLPAPPAIRPITSTLICYQDNGIQGSAYTRYITNQDGLAGAPPPPPYGYAEMTTLTGTYNPVTNQMQLEGCFNDVDGTLGPNVYVTTTINPGGIKNTGLVGINGNESDANCNNDTPSGGPAAELVEVDLSEQPDAFDHDRDGCTDAEELDPTAARRGGDPANPNDCFQTGVNRNYTGIYNIQATRQAQDVCKGGQPAASCTGVPDQPPTLVPGSYFSCKASVNDPGPITGTRTATLGIFCYADTVGINVNNHVAGAFGDGLGGTPPPEPFAEVHGSQTKTTIQISAKPAKQWVIAPVCFDNPHSQLGRVYIPSITIPNTKVPQVTALADLYIAQPNAACAGSPIGAPFASGVPLSLSRQSQDLLFDSDSDNCSDAEELANTGSQGGLRDPYNWGDFMSVHTGPVANLQKDAVVSVADISAIVARFGTNDSSGTTKINRNTDPKFRPSGTIYHPSYDRGGPIPNGGGGGISRQNPSTTGTGGGSITIADISAAVSQFGNSCAA